LGKGTLHYEIFNDKEKYWMYSRIQIAWWDCKELCVNVEEARKLAPFMETKERVDIFGNEKLAMIYDSLDEEEFKQEYELFCADSSTSYFPLDLIKSCVFEDDSYNKLEDNIDPDEIVVGYSPVKDDNDKLIVTETIMEIYKKENINWYYEEAQLDNENNAYDVVSDIIDRLLLSMQIHGFGRKLLFGMDVGRNRDSAELSLFEEIEVENFNLHIERLSIELIGMPFRIQKDICRLFLKTLPIDKFNIDGTKGSHGEDLAETLMYEYPDKVEAIHFDPESKSEMVKNFKFRLEDKTIAIFNNNYSIKQIHSIKRIITESANIKFGAKKSSKHHGDKFWSKALASIGGEKYDRDGITFTNVIRLGNSRSFVSTNDDDNSLIKYSGNDNKGLGLVSPKIYSSVIGGSPFSDVFFDRKMHN